MTLPIKWLVLTHPNLGPGKAHPITEITNDEFNKILSEYDDLEYPKGIPKVWTRNGEGFRIFPTPKDSDEFKNSGYKLAIIRETKQ